MLPRRAGAGLLDRRLRSKTILKCQLNFLLLLKFSEFLQEWEIVQSNRREDLCLLTLNDSVREKQRFDNRVIKTIPLIIGLIA